MTRTRLVLTTFAAAALATSGLAACGGGDKSLEEAVQEAVDTMPVDEMPVDETLVPGELGTIPDMPGISSECTDLYNGWISAMGAASAAMSGQTGDDVDMVAYFESLAAAVPDDIADDVRVISAAWAGWTQALADHDNDITALMSDPAAMAAMEAISSDEVTAASDAVGAYFDEVCGTTP